MPTYNAQVGSPSSAVPIGVPTGYAAAILANVAPPKVGQLWPRNDKSTAG